MMSGVNYVIYGCFSARTTPRLSLLSLYRSLTLKENIAAVIAQDKVIDENLKKQIKNTTLYACRQLLIT